MLALQVALKQQAFQGPPGTASKDVLKKSTHDHFISSSVMNDEKKKEGRLSVA